MEKLTICLKVPSIEKEFDVCIPTFITIKELTELFVKAVGDISNHYYISSGSEALCLEEMNILLVREKTVSQYNIQNGDHIVML